ncbi:glycoside hydrolase family 97 protein [Sphingobacterium alkalisoli]|uniref:Glycoside hydrolase family 97 protein n=1 Tax=Sphingobacterium alkalisoli TaxID=1874115 RepID=A0A4U0H543_9SPHI|nr:glycoside hydrolase family 97 protein [Sphingobacterium alkalisoli]TJY66857.1 glycoside hydrolase family 97 protein [Sphingobacterium alkalisoli]GGH13796.1 alpha-glucosidase [Sphingobacterium alkalisoli]
MKSFSILITWMVVGHFALANSLWSPNKSLELRYEITNGKMVYELYRSGTSVIKASKLGVVLSDADLSQGLRLIKASKPKYVLDTYDYINGKRFHNVYRAQTQTIRLVNEKGRLLDVTFHLSDNGLAFRYFFPDIRKETYVEREITSYHFHNDAKAWLQPVAVAKSGWEQTNPSYEENYEYGIPVGTTEATASGWVYPALFQHKDTWVSITETGLEGNYCATRLSHLSPKGEYSIAFPDEKETMYGERINPKSNKKFYSPWRIIGVGSLADIVESTIGSDLAAPSRIKNTSFVRTGKSSWSWINSKDNFIIYDEQKKYIDFAHAMNWEYCLIDVNWDTKIGYDKIKELAAYAKTKNVGLILWYNSAGDWNTVEYSPKNKMLTSDVRKKEFALLQKMGIKGVKIDFFGGDGRSVIAYYHEILKDAATYKILVNFHGATLPRSWSRTYPNLVTVEAVKGFEMVTFEQKEADRQAKHSTMLPFTRNLYDPMDFTPMNLYKIPSQVLRRTSSAFELATAVLFQSGIQHYAESPEGMNHVSAEVQDLLKILPSQWDDIRFIAGYPGEYVVLARRCGKTWYIAGINGEDREKTIDIDLSFIEGDLLRLFRMGKDRLAIEAKNLNNTQSIRIIMGAQDGFVLKN